MIIGAGIVRAALITEGKAVTSPRLLTPRRSATSSVLTGIARVIELILCGLPDLLVMFFTSFTLSRDGPWRARRHRPPSRRARVRKALPTSSWSLLSLAACSSAPAVRRRPDHRHRHRATPQEAHPGQPVTALSEPGAVMRAPVPHVEGFGAARRDPGRADVLEFRRRAVQRHGGAGEITAPNPPPSTSSPAAAASRTPASTMTSSLGRRPRSRAAGPWARWRSLRAVIENIRLVAVE